VKRASEIYAEAVMNNSKQGWHINDHGALCLRVDGLEIMIEPLLFGGCQLAVYNDDYLIADKLPMTIGTPSQNGRG
jgi:hypothetical protein